MADVSKAIKDLARMCRACLTISDEHISLRDDELARSAFMKISNIFVSEDDELPMWICPDCLHSTHQLLEFRRKCHENEVFLRSIIEEAAADGEPNKKMRKKVLGYGEVETPVIPEDLVLEVPFLDPLLPCQEHVEKTQEPTTDENGNPIIKCPICWIKCTGYKEFESHTTTHVSKENIVCPRCGIRYERMENFKSHMYVHTNQTFCCTECGKTFLRRKTLTDHMAQRHFLFKRKTTSREKEQAEQTRKEILKKISENSATAAASTSSTATGGFKDAFLLSLAKTIKCPIDECTYSPSDTKEFERHMAIHVPRTMRDCPICLQAFARYENLRNHMWSHTDERFPCQECNKECQNPKALRTHQRTSHFAPTLNSQLATDVIPRQPRGKMFPCNFCGKTFLVMTALQLHLKIHTRKKPFSCNICDATFRIESNLRIHMQGHKKAVNYSCKVCQSVFPSVDQLNKHSVTHSTGALCNECGQLFESDVELAEHATKAHVDLVCEDCGETFKREKLFKDHMLIHTGERPHNCEVCQKTFRTFRHTRQHMSKMHKVEWKALLKAEEKQKKKPSDSDTS